MKIRPYQVRTQEDWDRLFNFAESFGHAIDQRFPHIVLINAAHQWVGYGCMISVPTAGAPGAPVAVTAWHPQMSPRDLVRGMQVLTDWAMVAYGKAAVLIPDGSPLAGHMDALGFESWEVPHRMYITKRTD
jgi:hypothetical protein